MRIFPENLSYQMSNDINSCHVWPPDTQEDNSNIGIFIYSFIVADEQQVIMRQPITAHFVSIRCRTCTYIHIMTNA